MNASTATAMGVMALELSSGTEPSDAILRQQDAARLLALVARDLDALVPGMRSLDLVFAAAHFDPAEALRPGWPLHRRLEELHARAPGRGDGPRTIAFGADADGDAPLPFVADPNLCGGSLRVLPFLLAGEADALADVSARMEESLLETGMAAADTALLAQEAFGANIEHARYLTAHDLAAMTAMQYRHQGLEHLWPLIETALLAPHESAVLDSPPEPLVSYADGEARIALFTPDAWRMRHATSCENDGERLSRLSAACEMRQKQYAAVLQAHGIEVVYEQVGMV